MQEPPSSLQLCSLEWPLCAWLFAVWAGSPFFCLACACKSLSLLLLHNHSWISQSISVKPWGILSVGNIVLFFPRGGDSDSYEIISTFPQRVYTDNSRSLQECGLIPNVSLLLRRRDPSQQEGTGLQTA